MASTPIRLMTLAEFERLPESAQGRMELRNGELVQLAPPKLRHYVVQRRLRRLLDKSAGESGLIDIEFPFRPLPEYEHRIADVVYISPDRWSQADLDGYFQGAPDLVIEVLSPSNTVNEIFDKKALCLENGSREFWVVDIDHRQVEVSTPGGHAIAYKSGQQIPLYFGGSVPVDEIFS